MQYESNSKSTLSTTVLAAATVLLACTLLLPDVATAQNPAATVKDGSGDVTFKSFVDGSLLAPGYEFGTIPATGSGTRMMWWSDKAAFRAGEVGIVKDGTQWDADSIGNYSVALGADTKASDRAAVALGQETTANGRRSLALGDETEASGNQSVAMGDRSAASGKNAVAMNDGTTASAFNAVAMGNNSTASESSALAVGSSTTASEPRSVAMGTFTEASGAQAFAMGNETIASGSEAFAIGQETTAAGSWAFAGGLWARAASDNTFVWADGSDSDSDKFSSADDPNNTGVTGSQTFHVKASGGARFVTASDNSAETYISGGTAGWSNTSTRTAKTNVKPADPAAVLEAVEAMPVSTWEYKAKSGEGQGTRHIGPMAEDFHGELPYDLGSSDDHINSINADGVALGAIKGLAQKVRAQQATIDSLREQVQKIDAMQKRLAALEANTTGEETATASLPGQWVLVLLLALGLGGLLGTGLHRYRRL